ncbi:hypothetical protein BMG03_03440 [Thioclava nitratireducens]|uniref:Flagellar FliJ protein n=1 Tax=Thioclava nitratireducens TaxID=1915078 RepID=A0ABM6IE40_9RHOB|nr:MULTISPECIES: flagellar FliJ family protein [Thioclava]AQS46953.1 hypothetical protein BMG03_03440 [Thioclava nitratireducens]OWY08591.1 hypothetical protein B6V74_12210 [Thioclava sp. F42-5]OWY11753.1 hypothetical protein B6V72_15585 [Thioclava sp. F34-6]
MARNRIAALEVIGRLRRRELEEQAGELSKLNAQVARLESERDTLTARARAELHVTSPETAPYAAGFREAVRETVSWLDQEIGTLNERRVPLEDRMRELFREAKTYDTLLDRARAERAAELAKREQAQVEERTLQRWLRDRDAVRS